MDFLNNKDYVTYHHFCNLRVFIPCVDDLHKVLSIIKPDIEFYFPIVNASIVNEYKIIYTNYDFYIHVSSVKTKCIFNIYKYSDNSCMDSVDIYRNTPEILYSEKGIKAFSAIIGDSVLVHDNKHIKLDKMLYMSECDQRNELQTFVDEERKQFLKDRHESDQIIGKLDNKILQYKDKIRELEAQINSNPF